MILLINRLIILLLLVLQSFAPLVHAHVHIINSDEGVHIHGITTASSHQHQFSNLDNIGCSDAAIGMHSAIQQKKYSGSDVYADSYYLGKTDFAQFSVFIKKTIGFSPPDVSQKSLQLLSLSAPRAPPL